MSKILKITIFSVLGLVLAVAILAGIFLIQADRHENATRQLLTQEATRLPLPDTCKKASPDYQVGSIDNISTLRLQYTCNMLGKTAHDAIVLGLKNLGYSSELDYSVPDSVGKVYFYTFAYSNANYRVNYNFNPPTTNYATDDHIALQNIQITVIEVSLTRN